MNATDILLSIAIVGIYTIIYIYLQSQFKNDKVRLKIFALGFILLSIYDTIPLNIEDVLFGQILGVSNNDVLITFVLLLIVVITSLIFYKQFLFISFDPIGAKVSGLRVNLLDNIFLIVLSLAIISIFTFLVATPCLCYSHLPILFITL